jgi:hypothetical protein
VGPPEAYFLNGHLAEDPGLKLDEVVRARLLTGTGISAYDYLATLRQAGPRRSRLPAQPPGMRLCQSVSC